jgi:DNA-binding LytR/AlgR family response regulator
MMRVVLADDEPLALRRLLRALEAVAGITVVGVASDGDAALQRIIELVPDLAILDIEMPGRSGLAVAAAIPAERRPEIVFLTAFDRYAADAFSVEAVDYLLKPVRAERLVQALARASRRRAERLTGRDPGMLPSTADLDGHTLHLPNRDGGRDLPQAQIVWIEAAKDYALIYTFTRSHILRVTMAELAQQLHPSILRVHRSAFVAAAVVQRRVRIERGLFSLLLLDGTRVQVGPSYAQSVKAHLKALRPELD